MPSTDNNLVRIRDLHFSRGHSKIFNGIDIDIPKGKITAIMGPSGTGKTTLLKLIGGQLKPQQGTILFHGENIPAMKTKKLYEVRKKMGMLFQSGALLTDMSVFDNIAFPLREHTELPEVMIRDLVLMKLQAVGLRGARDLNPSQLSGGMARRVAFARAIALDPEMIMFDEPFTGQDPISMGVLVQLIRSMNEALELTSVMVSHDIEETMAIADKVYIISQGKIMGYGSPEEMNQSDSPWISQFVHGEADGPVHFHYQARSYSDDIFAGENRD
ncbi:MAG: ABC transporter ATP-binding protein [gamma proteobacterium symbiont of Lucinoma myriamae]|nr:ABC transporter ATP-binding protein [gamma proteobacterium symbiont of Lucinoma myriamae]MCU7819189.1 ABC transporter ATP-binding protein [gamma proteobacterium symbiont of Lucinoma myriamae]MCU7833007.1 ABC transporter ATP-binding protein [gamma proteobacterium symbiont of Lucinoma myriamae]